MALEQRQIDQDLIYEDGEPMENAHHGTLAWDDLVLPLRAWLRRTGFQAFVGSNSPVGYERGVPALGPDLYVVNGGVDHGQEGWASWREGGLTPTLAVEMLCPSTEARDRGEKMRIYRDVLKTTDYFLFQSETGGVEYYRLKDGIYARTHSNRRGQFRCASLPLLLGVLNGRLRWFERNGAVLPNSNEMDALVQEGRARADEERARADEAEAQAGRLRARLRALGIEDA